MPTNPPYVLRNNTNNETLVFGANSENTSRVFALKAGQYVVFDSVDDLFYFADDAERTRLRLDLMTLVGSGLNLFDKYHNSVTGADYIKDYGEGVTPPNSAPSNTIVPQLVALGLL